MSNLLTFRMIVVASYLYRTDRYEPHTNETWITTGLAVVHRRSSTRSPNCSLGGMLEALQTANASISIDRGHPMFKVFQCRTSKPMRASRSLPLIIT